MQQKWEIKSKRGGGGAFQNFSGCNRKANHEAVRRVNSNRSSSRSSSSNNNTAKQKKKQCTKLQPIRVAQFSRRREDEELACLPKTWA